MRPEKTTIVADLQEKLNASPFLLITDYTGIKVEEFSTLRTALYAAGAEIRVVKNTFIRRALSDAGLPELDSELTGQTAIVTGEADVAAAAKAVKTFAKDSKKLTVKGGIVDRVVVSAQQVEAIADLPSREVLLSQLLGTLQAPASSLVRLLNEPASSLARVLKAKSEVEAA